MGTNYSFERRVEPEALDSLSAADPAAQRSRRDLRRLHVAMGTLSIMTRALATEFRSRPLRILEIGAGDGSLALRFANRRTAHEPPVSLTLLDRQDVVGDETLNAFRSIGWTPTVATADVFDWFAEPGLGRWDIVFANLFVHHFLPGELARLMTAISVSTSLFFCCEPRRSRIALIGSHLVGLVGAGVITREDAVLSVRAGFNGRELTAMWPNSEGWNLQEYSAGLFSHCFLARRQ